MEQPQLIRLMLIGEDRVFAGRMVRVLREAEPGSLVLVGTVAGCEEAGVLISRARPDVILLDLETAGFEGIGQISSQCTALILAVAAQRDVETGARAVRSGARGIVLKTDAPETIRKALRKVKEGEVWLDRCTSSQILREVIAGQRKGELATNEGIACLTSRERDIVCALVRCDGANGRTLAAQLGISDQTLRNHFSAIYRKLGIPNRSGLVAFATRLRLDAAA
jgi:two-component system nitrate/nitrite response regulator NarL